MRKQRDWASAKPWPWQLQGEPADQSSPSRDLRTTPQALERRQCLSQSRHGLLKSFTWHRAASPGDEQGSRWHGGLHRASAARSRSAIGQLLEDKSSVLCVSLSVRAFGPVTPGSLLEARGLRSQVPRVGTCRGVMSVLTPMLPYLNTGRWPLPRGRTWHCSFPDQLAKTLATDLVVNTDPGLGRSRWDGRAPPGHHVPTFETHPCF